MRIKEESTFGENSVNKKLQEDPDTDQKHFLILNQILNKIKSKHRCHDGEESSLAKKLEK